MCRTCGNNFSSRVDHFGHDANAANATREERGGGGGQDGPIGAGGPDVPAGGDAPPSGERRKLKLAPRSKPTGQAAGSGAAAAPAPASGKKASIFGGGKAHDEFAYEVGWGVGVQRYFGRR